MANPVGRPTKYKHEYYEDVIRLMGKGFTKAMVCAEWDITEDTFYAWKKEGAVKGGITLNFSEAVRVGESRLKAFMDLQGLENMGNKFYNDRLYQLMRRNMFHEGDDSKVRIRGLVGKSLTEKTDAIYKAIEDGELSTAQVQSLMNGFAQAASIEERTELKALLEKFEDQNK